jgi:hypothetical protein
VQLGDSFKIEAGVPSESAGVPKPFAEDERVQMGDAFGANEGVLHSVLLGTALAALAAETILGTSEETILGASDGVSFDEKPKAQ